MQRHGGVEAVMRVLIVDDEYDIRRVLRLVLENEGYEVLEKADGAEAVEYLHEDASVDLCIMDIMMPVMSGIEAASRIRDIIPTVRRARVLLRVQGFRAACS